MLNQSIGLEERKFVLFHSNTEVILQCNFSKMNNTSGLGNFTSNQMDNKVITWCVAYAIVTVAIIVNNVAAIAAFAKSRLLRKFGNYFLVNLAVADLMVGTIALPMYIHLIYISPYVGSSVTQPMTLPFQIVHTGFDVFSGMASVFTLTVIALERVYAILCPLRYRSLSRTTYFVILAVVWILAGALTGTWLLTLFKVIHQKIFAFALAILSFTSLMVMILSYVALWLKIKLWSRNKQRTAGEKERNIAVAIGIITVVFLFTWTPFHIMNILVNFKASLLDGIPYEVIYLAKFLHYSNSIVNPVIYCYKISEFRRALKNLVARKKKSRETRV
ncbi:adenosine receptor A2b-like [Oculina patagonica]